MRHACPPQVALGHPARTHRLGLPPEHRCVCQVRLEVLDGVRRGEAGPLLRRHPRRLEPRRDVGLQPVQQLLGDNGRLSVGQVLHCQCPVGQHVLPGRRLNFGQAVTQAVCAPETFPSTPKTAPSRGST